MKGNRGKRLFVVMGLLLAFFQVSHVSGVEASAGIGSYLAIGFADGLVGVSTYGLPALTARGLRGVAFVPTANVGLPKRMTLQQLKGLDVAGWDVASHLDNGGDCTQMSPEELSSRLVASRTWLLRNGFVKGARIFGPPSQKWAPELTPLATQAGYEAVMVRTQRGGIVPQNLALEYAGCANKIALEQIAAKIESAKTTPGRLLVLSFHDVVQSNPTGTQADVQRLEAVLDLVVASGLPIVTVSDLMSSGD
jgi:peptidoglycan/xylan/chitin deacetylase (PgdA/CDA1 family)